MDIFRPFYSVDVHHASFGKYPFFVVQIESLPFIKKSEHCYLLFQISLTNGVRDVEPSPSVNLLPDNVLPLYFGLRAYAKWLTCLCQVTSSFPEISIPVEF